MSNPPIESLCGWLAVRLWENLFGEIHSVCLSFPSCPFSGLINLSLCSRDSLLVADKMSSDLNKYFKRFRCNEGAVQNHWH